MNKLILFIFFIFSFSKLQSQNVIQLFEKGMNAFENGDTATAIIIINDALVLSETNPIEDLDLAVIYYNLGSLYEAVGQLANSEPFYLRASQIYVTKLGKENEFSIVLKYLLGRLYKNLGRFDKSLPYYDDIYSICKIQWQNKAMYGSFLLEYGQVLQEMNEFVKAKIVFEEAVQLYESTLKNEKSAYATSLNQLAIVYDYIGSYDLAESLFVKAGKVYSTVFGIESIQYITTLHNLAGHYSRIGKPLEAESIYIKTGISLKELYGTQSEKYANNVNQLGSIYLTLGKYDKAEINLILARDIYEKTVGINNIDYLTTLHNLALLYSDIGESGKAESLYLKVLASTEELVGRSNAHYAATLHNIGVFYHEMDNYDDAKTFITEACKIYLEIYGENNISYLKALSSLGRVNKSLEEYEEAKKCFSKVISIMQKIVDKDNYLYARSLNDMALLLIKTGEYDEAEKLSLESVQIAKELLGTDNIVYAAALYNLGTIYYFNKRLVEGEINIVAAVNIYKEMLDEGHILLHRGYLDLATIYFDSHKFDLSIKYFSDALAAINTNLLQKSLFLSANELSKYSYKANLDLKLLESLQSKLYRSNPEITPLVYNQILFYNYFLLRRSLNFNKYINNTTDSNSINLVNKWQNCLNRINYLKSNSPNEHLDELHWVENEANGVEKELLQFNSGFKDIIDTTQVHWSDIKNLLKDDEAAIEFISFNHYNGRNWTDSILYGALILIPREKNPIYVPLFEEAQLITILKGDSLRTFANLLYTNAQIRNVEHDISYGDSLYQLVWKPLLPYLTNIAQIYYSPSGLLHKITFDAIPFEGNNVLSDKYRLNRLSSTGSLLDLNNEDIILSSIALFGGIQYDIDTNSLKQLAFENKVIQQHQFFIDSSLYVVDSTVRGGSWGYLFGSKKEVLNIQELFNDNKISTNAYIDKFATEEAVKKLNQLNSPTVLHFSTHGFFYPDPQVKKDDLDKRMRSSESEFKFSDNPLIRSGLILAGANYVWKGNKPLNGVDDGILTAYEVSNLYLPNTKLVIMSACETGLGEIDGNEGVYGLQRAFKIAGADYIIMTLWKVLDNETCEFMTLFYENLLQIKSIQKAFKLTQDFMKNKYRDEPYKWAAFVLIY
jgi:tetratricopeptide (TPR) repeat protein